MICLALIGCGRHCQKRGVRRGHTPKERAKGGRTRKRTPPVWHRRHRRDISMPIPGYGANCGTSPPRVDTGMHLHRLATPLFSACIGTGNPQLNPLPGRPMRYSRYGLSQIQQCISAWDRAMDRVTGKVTVGARRSHSSHSSRGSLIPSCSSSSSIIRARRVCLGISYLVCRSRVFPT